MEQIKRIGVVGTGLIGRGLIMALENAAPYVVSRILTRREIDKMEGFPSFEKLTNSVEELVVNSDLIIECSGDVIYGTDVVDQAIKASLPVVTMNSELQVTTGSYFARRGLITEAEGDQPGCLAALHESVMQMGFKPLVYGNVKGFLKLDPPQEEMEFWSGRNGTSLEMTTSFTDGTKVQIEQVFVANGLGATIAVDGLMGVLSDDAHSGGIQLAEKAKELDHAVSDYILSPKTPPGVFITAEIDPRHKEALRYYKMGEGPYYTLLVNYHLCHLEILKTIGRVLSGGGVLLNNSVNPKISAAAIAKHDLYPGQEIKRGIGSFEVRGIAVEISRHSEHVPIGLLSDAVITRHVKEGQILTFEDVALPQSLALRAWMEIKENALYVATR